MSNYSYEIPEMEILVPSLDSSGIPHTTDLFRHETNTMSAAQYLVEISSFRTPILSSIACSIGAELDTVLAYYRLLGGQRGIIARGYDVSDAVIGFARSGQYKLSIGAKNATIQAAIRSQVEPLGIETIAEQHNGEFMVTGLNTQKLRSTHNVEFHNTKRTGVDIPLSDVVLLNNILYHLSPEAASEILGVAIRSTASKGLLSIAGIGGGKMGTIHEPTETDYIDWLIQRAGPILSQAGFVPKSSEHENEILPTLYQRK